MHLDTRKFNAEGAARNAGTLGIVFGATLSLWGTTMLAIMSRAGQFGTDALMTFLNCLILVIGLLFIALGSFARRRVAWATWVQFIGSAAMAVATLGTILTLSAAPTLVYTFALASLSSVTAWLAILAAFRERRAIVLARIVSSEGDSGAHSHSPA